MCNCDGFCGCEDTLVLPGIPGPPGPPGPGSNGYLLYQGNDNELNSRNISGAGYSIALLTPLPSNTNIYHRINMQIQATSQHLISLVPKIAGVAIPNLQRRVTSATTLGGVVYTEVTYMWSGGGSAGSNMTLLVTSTDASARLNSWDYTAWIV